MKKDDFVPTSDYDALRATWIRRQAKNVADLLVVRFWAGRFTDMHGAAIAAL